MDGRSGGDSAGDEGDPQKPRLGPPPNDNEDAGNEPQAEPEASVRLLPTTTGESTIARKTESAEDSVSSFVT